MIHYDGLSGIYTAQTGDTLFALAKRYSTPSKSLIEQNRGVLAQAQRTFCLTKPDAKPCTGYSAWGGMTPPGCCPDAGMLDAGEVNIDLLPAGTRLDIPGYTAPPPGVQPPPSPSPPVLPPVAKAKLDLPKLGLAVGAGLLLWWGLK